MKSIFTWRGSFSAMVIACIPVVSWSAEFGVAGNGANLSSEATCLAEQLANSAADDSRAGDWTRALLTLDLLEALQPSECASDRSSIGAEILHGDLLWKRGDFPQGEHRLSVAREHALAAGFGGLAAEAQASIAEVAFARAFLARSIGPDEARTAYALALAESRSAGRDDLVARSLGRLGVIDERQGELGAAEDLYRQALALAEDIDAADMMHLPLAHLGGLADDRNEFDAAGDYYNRAITAAARSSKREHMVFALINHAGFARRTDQISTEAALVQAYRAHEIARQLEHQIAVCLTYLTLARLHAQNGDADTAMSRAQYALSLARKNAFRAYEDFARSIIDSLQGG